MPGGSNVDEQNRPLWQAKCQSCHELRSPANRSLTAAQWTATVERMIKVRQAPISPPEAEKITAFLVTAECRKYHARRVIPSWLAIETSCGCRPKEAFINQDGGAIVVRGPCWCRVISTRNLAAEAQSAR